MEFVARELDDPTARPCGRCAGCAGDFMPVLADPVLEREAIAFLRRSERPIEPRKQWPVAPAGGSIRIPAEQQLREGRALCFYGDAGWGRMVVRGKYEDGRFSDELVVASAALIERWRPDPPPLWVTSVPSLRRPELVQDFAKRLAERLRLPYVAALAKSREGEEQKRMANSYQQWQNVDEVVLAVPGAVREGAVLLVDDIFDSRWTLTVCGQRLMEAGAGPVHPFTLADASQAGDL